ncbi:hypothetical protein G6F60_014272 [Rhizopus arrhizus]|nr:hypothetical protein G6F60_014272 [Rhizopus arrhizus]
MTPIIAKLFFPTDPNLPGSELNAILMTTAIFGVGFFMRPVGGIIHQLMGGLRATMGYVGCATIDDMRTKPKFVKLRGAGQRESHVHDVTITKEPPNYRA